MTLDVELAYTTSASVHATMSINSGTVSGEVGSYLKAEQTVDYANVTVYIKKSTGTTIKTFTQKIYHSLGKITWKGTH